MGGVVWSVVGMAGKLAQRAAGYEGEWHAPAASQLFGAKLAARPGRAICSGMATRASHMPLLTYAVATVATVKGFLLGAGLMAAALAAKRRRSAGR